MLTSKPADHRMDDAPTEAAAVAAAGSCLLRHGGLDRRPYPSVDTRVLAFLGKGGAGKSTTLINLAVIALREGLRVGIADADPQRSSFQWYRRRKSRDIPARYCRPDQLGDVLNLAQRAKLDWLFIDMSPDAALALEAARVADFILVMTRPTFLDLGATRTHVNLLQSGGVPYAVATNAAPPRRQGIDAPMTHDAREAIRDFTKRLWRGQITQRHVIPYSTAGGHGVVEIEKDGPAADEYRALWAVIVRQTQNIRRS